MKILFVHFSDLHFKSVLPIHNSLIHKAAISIRELFPIDMAIIVLSGDITHSGNKDEYVIAKDFIEKYKAELESNGVLTDRIIILVAPGNHDIDRRKSIITESKDKMTPEELGKKIELELEAMSNFFDFAKEYSAFEESQLFYDKSIYYDGYQLQVLTLNTAPFSETNESSKENHYIPEYVLDTIYRDDKTNLHITIMHHSWEWFSTVQRYKLEEKITSCSDLLFQGHDHFQTQTHLKSSDSSYIQVSKGGMIDFQKSGITSKFNTILYDTQTNESSHSHYEWNEKGEVFMSKSRDKCNINPKKTGMCPLSSFQDEVKKDINGLAHSFLDYFVFPRVSFKSDGINLAKEGVADCDTIFQELKYKKIISITGNKESGKTTLLKYLYIESVKQGFTPLMIYNKQFSNNKIEKLLQGEFEDQFGAEEYLWPRYIQLEKENKIVFIDDFESIKSEKARCAFLDYLFQNVGMVVLASNNVPALNIAESVEKYLIGDEVTGFKIEPMLKKKRNLLVEKICISCNVECTADIEVINGMIDYVVQHQPGLLPIYPGYLIECIKYFVEDKTNTQKGEKVFGVIFETNIRNTIIKNVNPQDIQIYLTLLEEIAYSMYFDFAPKLESLPYSDALVLIKKYNETYKNDVDCGQFLEDVDKSGVMHFSNGKRQIDFCNINTYAYFVAKKINRKLEKDSSDLGDVKYIMKNICLGINEQIVLFLSYIRSNTKITEIFIQEAAEILQEYEELDLDKKNILLIENAKRQEISEPSNVEKQQHEDHLEKLEDENQKSIIEYKGALEYDEKEAETPGLLLFRALKCIEIMGKSLISQYSILEGPEKESIIEQLYILPNKLLFALLKPFDENLDQIIESIEDGISKDDSENIVSKDKILDLLGRAACILMFAVYYDVSANCSDQNTIKMLRKFDGKASNYQLQCLLMEERAGKTEDFINMAIKVYDSTKRPQIKSLVKSLVKLHMYNKNNIKNSTRDKIYAKFFPDVKKGARYMGHLGIDEN